MIRYDVNANNNQLAPPEAPSNLMQLMTAGPIMPCPPTTISRVVPAARAALDIYQTRTHHHRPLTVRIGVLRVRRAREKASGRYGSKIRERVEVCEPQS